MPAENVPDAVLDEEFMNIVAVGEAAETFLGAGEDRMVGEGEDMRRALVGLQIAFQPVALFFADAAAQANLFGIESDEVRMSIIERAIETPHAFFVESGEFWVVKNLMVAGSVVDRCC